MSRSRLFILGLVALAFGGFLATQVYKNLQTRASATTMATTDVLVAARDIQIGTRVGEADVKSVKFPSADLPPGFYTSKSKISGRGAILPISKGEFFLPGKLAAENSGTGLPSLIPPGMRAGRWLRDSRHTRRCTTDGNASGGQGAGYDHSP